MKEYLPPTEDQTRFGNYLLRQMGNLGVIAAATVVGLLGGRAITAITKRNGLKFGFVKEFNLDFFENRLRSHRLEDGTISFGTIGAVLGAAFGGFYQGHKSYIKDETNRRHITDIQGRTIQMQDTLHELRDDLRLRTAVALSSNQPEQRISLDGLTREPLATEAEIQR